MSYVNADLGYIVTKPSNIYAKLDSYNQDNLIGPPEPPVTPSMQYITLPKDHVNWGYDALTHDSDGNGYYSVTAGYGNRCTTFNTAKCPTNQIIGPAGAPAPAPAPAVREGFCMMEKKKMTSRTIKDQVKDMNLVIFVDNENCNHCRNFRRMLNEEGVLDVVELKDINVRQNRDQLRRNGGQGVPFIVSKTTKTSVTGLPPNLASMLTALQNQQQPSAVSNRHAQALKDLRLVVYVSDRCSYCRMYKEFMAKNGLRPYIKIVHVENKEETDNDPFLRTNRLVGYPTTYSCKYKTSFPGVPKSVDHLISLLTTQNT